MGQATSASEMAAAAPGLGRDLLERHGDALYRYALLRLRSRHAAEDAVQETFVAALAQAGGHGSAYQGRSAERTWLVGILRHKVGDQLRRLARESGGPPVDASEPAWEEFFDRRGRWRLKPEDWGRATNDDPHRLLERGEVRAILAQCLGAMPPRLARVFMLREVDGVASEEICKDFDITPTNLWTLMHRARVRLRACLGKHGMGEATRD